MNDDRKPWHGPHRPDEALVESVLRAQCPQVLAGEVRYLSEGWDFTAFDVADRWIARFPKREEVVAGIPRERIVLEAIEELGGAPVPRDRVYGEPSEGFPLPFVVHRKIPGEPLDTLPPGSVGAPAAEAIGRAVGERLRNLHTLTSSLPEVAESDDDGMEAWLLEAKVILDRIQGELPAEALRRTRERLDTPPPRSERVLTHGDLGPEHILVDPTTHMVTGIIDWEDAGWWEASGDFVGLWAELGEPALQAALEAYGRPRDEALAARTRFHATRWMLHQVQTSEDGWKPEARGRWIALLTRHALTR